MFDSENTLTHNLRNQIRDLKDASVRETQQQFVLEGIRACTDVLNADAVPDTVVLRSDAKEQSIELADNFSARGSVVVQCGVKDMEKISQTKNAQDILCVLPYLVEKEIGDRVLVLDSVSDPGNVGTIIRTAAWFGLTDVILGEGCADLYNDKTIRSTAGSMFAVNILRKKNIYSTLAGLHSHTKIATVARNGVLLRNAEVPGKYAIVIGSEAHGLPKEVVQLCNVQVTIQGGHGTESLNAAIAAAILCYEVSNE
ncbi:MAG: RNA methyltransferase [Ignavibacteria bacterium]|nr:RNA methyltransferase [Ignavibacteria bacterium]